MFTRSPIWYVYLIYAHQCTSWDVNLFKCSILTKQVADNTVSTVLRKLAEGDTLSEEEAYDLACKMLRGELQGVEIAAVLTAMRVRGESPDEVVGFARALRDNCIKVPLLEDERVHLLDTAGTGGDGLCTVNVSTVSALLTAACGGRVLKHGNRSMSSKSGSADFLEALGFRIDLDPHQVSALLRRTGFGFAFAQKFHPLLRTVAPIRRALGFRTIFNLVGPLSNPGLVRRQVLGVSEERLLKLYAVACVRLGYDHVLLVHGSPRMDEVSVFGPTKIVEVRHGKTEEYVISPEDLGLPRYEKLEPVQVRNPEESVRKVLESLRPGSRGPVRDFIIANTAFALYCAGIVKDPKDGAELCSKVIDDGVAIDFIRRVVEESRRA